PFCDADGSADGACRFRIALCLNNDDPRLACSTAPIDALTLTSPSPKSSDPVNAANATTLLNALVTIDPMSTGTVSGASVAFTPPASTANTCTGYLEISVPLSANGGSGHRRINVAARTNGGAARNRLTLTCNPAP
ncbi:MAG TPA: hypothetical protein VMT89_08280, partial [Candidatus Acidoferrales bacterium]|nr:hypothetical protein [Candidatus Acidoferrales bacterium]